MRATTSRVRRGWLVLIWNHWLDAHSVSILFWSMRNSSFQQRTRSSYSCKRTMEARPAFTYQLEFLPVQLVVTVWTTNLTMSPNKQCTMLQTIVQHLRWHCERSNWILPCCLEPQNLQILKLTSTTSQLLKQNLIFTLRTSTLELSKLTSRVWLEVAVQVERWCSAIQTAAACRQAKWFLVLEGFHFFGVGWADVIFHFEPYSFKVICVFFCVIHFSMEVFWENLSTQATASRIFVVSRVEKKVLSWTLIWYDIWRLLIFQKARPLSFDNA